MSKNRKRPEVEEAIRALRSKTVCARCGKRPIEWHSERHIRQPFRRIANMVDLGYRLEDVLAEIAQCEPLCRSCHMKYDGRTEALIQAAANANRGVKKAVRKRCAECGRENMGRCTRCYHRNYMRLYRQRQQIQEQP